jgi:hypothetical protein
VTADPRRTGDNAWLDLAAALQQQLRERDPDARVQATVAASGLLELHVRTNRTERAAARALGRRYEDVARITCERCGGHVRVARAGPVVTFLCVHCSTEG